MYEENLFRFEIDDDPAEQQLNPDLVFAPELLGRIRSLIFCIQTIMNHEGRQNFPIQGLFKALQFFSNDCKLNCLRLLFCRWSDSYSGKSEPADPSDRTDLAALLAGIPVAKEIVLKLEGWDPVLQQHMRRLVENV